MNETMYDGMSQSEKNEYWNETAPAMPKAPERDWEQFWNEVDEDQRREMYEMEYEPDYGGVFGADGVVYSDADPGL